MTIYLHYKKLEDLYNLVIVNKNSLLNQNNKQKIQQYRNAILKQLSPELVIDKTPFGKPFAQGNTIFFNHSHSQRYYALAYSHSVTDLGIDIEDLDREINMLALAKRYFHPSEIQTWQTTDYDQLFWIKVWTIKEAVLKAHGMGIRLQLAGLNTHAHPNWAFGHIDHPLIGNFFYQNFRQTHSFMTVAYRVKSDDMNYFRNIYWI